MSPLVRTRLFLFVQRFGEAARDRVEGRLRRGGPSATIALEAMLQRTLAATPPPHPAAPAPRPLLPPHPAAPAPRPLLPPRPVTPAPRPLPPSRPVAPAPRSRPAAQATLDGLRAHLTRRRRPAGPLPTRPPPPRRQRVDLDATDSEGESEGESRPQQPQPQLPPQEQQQHVEDFSDLMSRFDDLRTRYAAPAATPPIPALDFQ